MPAPVVVPVGRRLLRWLAYALFQLALVLAFALHSVAGLSSAFRRKNTALDTPVPTGRLTLPRHA
ncbi:hypothetical protein [Hymenobacter cellulosivorans]|uniref:Succinate dehydrogenase n=1 Tax=Hymenobacter cellulosivorans TaxID=2932249 RepID=A0ABY4F5H3_9BACT|nr:hypothetical protein [Hymenobacter cellulosivorans]UOQ51925.1 hypothetical protein MUN80_19445 [Hymenobacter cellulosivorans]